MGNILCVYSHLYVNRLKFPNLRASALGTLHIRLASPLRDNQLLPVFTFKTNFRRNIFFMTAALFKVKINEFTTSVTINEFLWWVWVAATDVQHVVAVPWPGL